MAETKTTEVTQVELTVTTAPEDDLMAQDAEAWSGVVGLLLGIVSMGIVLAVLTLLLSRNV